MSFNVEQLFDNQEFLKQLENANITLDEFKTAVSETPYFEEDYDSPQDYVQLISMMILFDKMEFTAEELSDEEIAEEALSLYVTLIKAVHPQQINNKVRIDREDCRTVYIDGETICFDDFDCGEDEDFKGCLCGIDALYCDANDHESYFSYIEKRLRRRLNKTCN